MRTLEPWVAAPLERFLSESNARVVLLTTQSGQVVAQHGFTRSLDVMAAAALGAGIVASTTEVARMLSSPGFSALVHQGDTQGMMLAGFQTKRGQWVGLVVFDRDTSVGIVQLFFGRMIGELQALMPDEPTSGPVLAENFENELNASLHALFGR